MSGVGYTIICVFTAVFTVPVAAGLWYMAKALWVGDAKAASRLAPPLLRAGVWLAGIFVLVASHGRSYRVALLLAFAPALLRPLGDWWPALRTHLWPNRNKPAA